VSPALAGGASAAVLESMTGVVPQFGALGLECRLSGSATPALDLQLGAFAGREAAAATRGLSRARERGELPDAWEPVYQLCREWQEPDTALGRAVAEVWCELDLIPGSETIDLTTLAPSVFVVLKRLEAGERMAAIQRALDVLVPADAVGPLRAAVDRCAKAAPGRAWVSHIGVMLGRPVQALRIHISGVPLWALGDYLAAAGWPGDVDRAIAAAELLLDRGDWLVVCLDVLGDLLPRVGLECGFDQRRGLDPRWEPLLSRLTDAGLNSVDKAQALLSWPGIVTPAGPAPWPDALITDGLSMPVHKLGVVERRLSHVKITVGSGEPQTAKAYFGAGHTTHDLLRPEPIVPTRPERRAAASVQDAIAAALAFLLARRNQAGWWLDFVHRARPAGVDEGVIGYRSDEWITAYVGAAIVGLDDPRARDAARNGLDRLLARRPRGGWGYNVMIPADADTTTWALRLATGLELADSARLREARAFVAGQIDAEGGVATYPATAAPALAEFTTLRGPYDGWCASHVCVTAAAASLRLGPNPLEFLRRAQADDGSWSAYWWHDDEYATAMAVQALSAAGDRAVVTRAVRWAESRIGSDGAAHSLAQGGPSPFATALALTALATGGAPRSGARERAVSWLLSQQRTDGSWEPSAQLRIPSPGQRDPVAAPHATSNYVDDLGVFTTATVLAALAHQ
jgi:hypothetical protein